MWHEAASQCFLQSHLPHLLCLNSGAEGFQCKAAVQHHCPAWKCYERTEDDFLCELWCHQMVSFLMNKIIQGQDVFWIAFFFKSSLHFILIRISSKQNRFEWPWLFNSNRFNGISTCSNSRWDLCLLLGFVPALLWVLSSLLVAV